MSLDTLRAKAVDVFLTKLASSPLADTTVRFENHPFQPGDSDYMYIYTMPVDAKRAAIGTTQKFQKHIGFIVVECFVSEAKGTARLNAMMDFAASALEESDYPLLDAERLITFTAKQKVHGLQYGAYRGTVMVPTERRACKA